MDSAFQLQREGEIEISELGAGGCWERGQMLDINTCKVGKQ